ncbi:MAG: hypothetical protein WC227_02675 [Patescibacteria group bacterium]
MKKLFTITLTALIMLAAGLSPVFGQVPADTTPATINSIPVDATKIEPVGNGKLKITKKDGDIVYITISNTQNNISPKAQVAPPVIQKVYITKRTQVRKVSNSRPAAKAQPKPQRQALVAPEKKEKNMENVAVTAIVLPWWGWIIVGIAIFAILRPREFRTAVRALTNVNHLIDDRISVHRQGFGSLTTHTTADSETRIYDPIEKTELECEALQVKYESRARIVEAKADADIARSLLRAKMLKSLESDDTTPAPRRLVPDTHSDEEMRRARREKRAHDREEAEKKIIADEKAAEDARKATEAAKLAAKNKNKGNQPPAGAQVT